MKKSMKKIMISIMEETTCSYNIYRTITSWSCKIKPNYFIEEGSGNKILIDCCGLFSALSIDHSDNGPL